MPIRTLHGTEAFDAKLRELAAKVDRPGSVNIGFLGNAGSPGTIDRREPERCGSRNPVPSNAGSHNSRCPSPATFPPASDYRKPDPHRDHR